MTPDRRAESSPQLSERSGGGTFRSRRSETGCAKKILRYRDSVRELANLLAETDLTEIEVQKGDLRVRVARNLT